MIVCALVATAATSAKAAYVDVTTGYSSVAGAELELSDGSLNPNSNTPGANEDPDKALDDDSGTKYLNFAGAGLNDAGEQASNPTGFVVVLDSPAAIGGVQFTTANDFASRDPGVVQIFGTNMTGTASEIIDLATAADLTEVYYGSTGVPQFATVNDGRFETTPAQFFAESDEYSAYVVIVRDLVRYPGSAPTNMQFAEVSLLQVPEPSTLALVGLAAVGLIGFVGRNR
ncbi:PEP-CTERM sorting domain-containing protein [Aeoliella mucimassa]|nr:PEP-CTERM sorting domain-containing protein [Aeoliella mucimassa]